MTEEDSGSSVWNAGSSGTRRNTFVIEAGDRPILAFSATSLAAAKSFSNKKWLFEELSIYRTGGEPIWDGFEPLAVRAARSSEHADVLVATAHDVARNEDTKFVFIFLVPIDPERH